MHSEGTSHAGKGVPNLELAAITVHPHLQLHRMELFPLPALPLPAGSHQLRRHASHYIALALATIASNL